MSNNYFIRNREDYERATREALESPNNFWGEIAKKNFLWTKEWDNVLSWDFEKPEVKWFEGAKLNLSENCLDRHLSKRATQTALIFEPNDPAEPTKHITYQQLYDEVNKMANVLKNKGVQKGDRVCIYLPMIPELAVAMLACARIGAVHSIVFAGFSSVALATRINDSECKLIITSDGGNRGAKTINLKEIVDETLEKCQCTTTVLVVKRTNETVEMIGGRDYWLENEMQNAAAYCPPEIMDAEDPLFILYTSGSTGKPKGMVHTTAGYMVYAAYSFRNVFQYEENDVFWCTADIGWITGHSYIVYGPLINGGTSILFEGVPSYPDYSRFWQIVEKHKVKQFYTAPTAIRALAKESLSFVKQNDISSLRILGTVGEPINEEAWNWYNDYVGNENSAIVDTWFQTETGGIMITPLPGMTSQKPTFATRGLPGIQLCLMDENGQKIEKNPADGRLCIEFPWPSIARTIWGDHERYRQTYFSTFKNCYFTGDGAVRDEDGDYRITGRVDDVIIVSGHNLGTAPIEDAINEHPKVAESAVVGIPDAIKGNALQGFITLKNNNVDSDEAVILAELNQLITTQIGAIAKLTKIQLTKGLPKTRSGKIMRRILRKIATHQTDQLGDISTLLNPEVVESIIERAKKA